MQNERENLYQPLTSIEYNIVGHVFRAYYDADKKLVFILDLGTSEIKPNVLLVINPVGDRKWDDILANDYGIDLETIRPKKDNKYQKLDIEYAGLYIYDNLITAYNNDQDLTNELLELDNLHNIAAENSANERLDAAEMTAEKSRETITRTQETISELQNRIRMLRNKLSTQRHDIGREPTKQSAAKILRTESLIDAAREKLTRAEKRLTNAQRRLTSAEDDADTARHILAILGTNNEVDMNLPAAPVATDVTITEPAPVPMTQQMQPTDIIPSHEPKAQNMADEDVKPLFDQDPDILDEEIAFKPIDFNAVPAEPVIPSAPTQPATAESIAPISFVPPIIPEPVMPPAEIKPAAPAVPVLDTITSVQTPNTEIDSELLGGFTTEPMGLSSMAPTVHEEPVVAPYTPAAAPDAYAQPTPAPEPMVSTPTPMPEIAVAPINSGFRPVSPINNDVAAPVAADTQKRKPTVIYYTLLIILIGLSIFTLWFYQKSMGDKLPELGATSPAVTTTETETSVTTEPVVTPEPEPVVIPEPVTEPIVEPEPVIEPEPVPIEIDATLTPTPIDEPESVPVVVEPKIIPVTEPESAFLSDESVGSAQVPSVEEILAKKPAYNVSQQEKMFVAAPDYETDTPADIEIPVKEDTIISTTEEVESCNDGLPPDENGCCTGEEFTIEGLCCAESTGECFEPMLQ